MTVILGIILRHLLAGVGGALVAKGIVDASMIEPLIGAVTTIAGVALSYRNKVVSGQIEK